MKPLRTLTKTALLLLCLLFVFTGCSSDIYKPGTYQGSANGYGGEIQVSVTVNSKKITEVKILSHQETMGIGSTAVDILPAAIIKAQSSQVDSVAGATMSSNAIKLAVESALKNAGTAGAAAVSFTPGTYTASEYGNNGYLNVEVTVSKDKITGIQVKEHWETKYLGDTAIQKISQDILDYQTLNVDSISGATITSNALKTAVSACLVKAGGDLTALQTPVPPKGSRITGVTEKSADVIVVGAGGAGLSAAVTAAEGGAKVIIIEKMPVIGGNTVRCASAFNTADPKRQAALPMTETLHDAVRRALAENPANDAHRQLIADTRRVYNEYLQSGSKTLFDAPEWHALQTYNGGDKVGVVSIIRTYTENTLSTLDWLESLGSPVLDKVSQGAGALWQRTHQFDAPAGLGLIDPLYTRAVALGVEIITEMDAKELLTASTGKVTGVKAYDAFGSEFHFSGTKGVILATGGYSNNKEMRMEFNKELTPDMVSTNQPGATGDGITMARALSAGTTGMDYVQVYPLATPGTGALQGRARKMSGLDDVIVVNKEGKRFVHEDARRDDFVAAIKKQTDGIVYDINDSTIVEEFNSFAENVEILISLGRIYKADTLADLARQLGMPAGNLEATVAEYNKMVADKNDPQFGRKLFAHPIEVGPFYATPRAPSIHHTMGGLTINTGAQVLNTSGQVIPGLYAAGEVVGGVHGSNRLGGNATADVTTYGRIAGRSVLR